jgi:hypothetical protein
VARRPAKTVKVERPETLFLEDQPDLHAMLGTESETDGGAGAGEGYMMAEATVMEENNTDVGYMMAEATGGPAYLDVAEGDTAEEDFFSKAAAASAASFTGLNLGRNRLQDDLTITLKEIEGEGVKKDTMMNSMFAI